MNKIFEFSFKGLWVNPTDTKLGPDCGPGRQIYDLFINVNLNVKLNSELNFPIPISRKCNF